jgi:hypothetical protein
MFLKQIFAFETNAAKKMAPFEVACFALQRAEGVQNTQNII